MLALVAGCDKQAKPAGAARPAPGIEKRYERGPLVVVVALDREELSIAERLSLTLTATVDETYEVELPAFGEKLEQFGIVDYVVSPPELAGEGKVRQAKSYTLEPFLSGEYKIPPMAIRFWKKDEPDAKRHELETEALTVRVASLLPDEVADLTIRDIAPPVALPRTNRTWFWGLLAAVAVGFGLAVFLLRRFRRGGIAAPAAVVLPPDERAYRELEALVARDLVKKGQLKPFYQGVSGILRRYIERRFGLHAPERTTEEFLAELGRNQALNPEHKALLKVFLRHCDLVKFAEHQPATAEIQKTFDSCKTFIAQTAARATGPSAERPGVKHGGVE